MLYVYDGRECIGHLLNRGKCGWQAYDAVDSSLGTFTTQGEAAEALSAALLSCQAAVTVTIS